jgi:hypothetical protein
VLLAGFPITTPTFATDTLTPSDLTSLGSWSKTVDFFNYVRAYASAHGQQPPSTDKHAYLHLEYINVLGFQVLYCGLVNITSDQYVLTIPIQTFLEHYKTQNGKDVIVASSFIMLLAFQENSSTIFQHSPDRNDTLYASFNLGYTPSFAGAPSLNNSAEIIPLTHSDDNTTWHWGMKYTNLTAIWWKTYVDPANPHFDPIPIAITTYDELTFTYDLKLNPSAGNATLTGNYIIGKMTNLWLISWLWFVPVIQHYNNSGCYNAVTGNKISNETVYQFLYNQGINMSIVLFQSSVLLNHSIYSSSNTGQNATDSEFFTSNGSISTFADDSERIFETSFGAKENYRLYNYTYDPAEQSYTSYEAFTRTSKVAGFASNPIFDVHTYLMRFIPLVVAHMDPPLYEEAKNHLFDMSYADYFYIISYPIYSGYKIVHDPTYTAFYSTTLTPSGEGGGSSDNVTFTSTVLNLIIAVAIIIIATASVTAVLLTRHRKMQQSAPAPTPSPSQPTPT